MPGRARSSAQAAGVSTEEADEALAGAGGDAKVAIVSLLAGLEPTRRGGAWPTRAASCAGPWSAVVRLGVRAALVDGRFVPGDVEIEDGIVTAYGLLSANGRGIASPGFVDLQVNGFGGVDFLDADADGYARAGESLLETGVTAYLPTLITAPEERLVAALGEIVEGGSGPRILGAHVEGPFLSPRRLGTHPPSARRDPDVDLLERMLAAGPVRLYTLAPELPGALELVDLLVSRGVVVSAGHSDANADEANAAFDRGVGTVTHLFNAMRPFSHRDPGVAGVGARPAGRDRPDHPRRRPPRPRHGPRSSGSPPAAASRSSPTPSPAAGVSGDGSYRLGDVSVEVRDGVVRRDGDGVLAGSVLTMIEAVRNLHALGVPLEAALDAATAVPARVIGAERRPDRGRRAGGRRRPQRGARDRARARRRRGPCRSLSRCLHRLAGAQYLAEIREQPAALRRLLEHRAEFTRVAEAATKHGTGIVRMVGHGSSDNAASFGVYAFGLLPGLTARATRSACSCTTARRSTCAARWCRAVAVGTDAGRARVRRAGTPRRRVHDRGHERVRVGARPRGRGGASARRRRRARGRRDEDVLEPLAALALLAGLPRADVATSSPAGSGRSPTQMERADPEFERLARSISSAVRGGRRGCS